MIEITVEPQGADAYRVTVTESGASTTHNVTATSSDVDRLSPGRTAEDLVEASFRFLLDRESKESILGRFELTVIGRYFPEYPAKIGDYL